MGFSIQVVWKEFADCLSILEMTARFRLGDQWHPPSHEADINWQFVAKIIFWELIRSF